MRFANQMPAAEAQRWPWELEIYIYAVSESTKVELNEGTYANTPGEGLVVCECCGGGKCG